MSSSTLHQFVSELHRGQRWAFAYTGNPSSCVGIKKPHFYLNKRIKAVVCIFFFLLLWGRTCVIYQPPLLVKFPSPYTRHSSVVKWRVARGRGKQHLYSYPRCRNAGNAANLWAVPSSSHIRSRLLHIFLLLCVTEIFTAAVANRRLDCAQITLPENDMQIKITVKLIWGKRLHVKGICCIICFLLYCNRAAISGAKEMKASVETPKTAVSQIATGGWLRKWVSVNSLVHTNVYCLYT